MSVRELEEKVKEKEDKEDESSKIEASEVDVSLKQNQVKIEKSLPMKVNYNHSS